MHRTAPLLLAGLWACDKDHDSDTALSDTGTTDTVTVTDTTDPDAVGTVTVLVGEHLWAGGEAVVHIARADGSFERSVAVAGSQLVLEGVPLHGFLSLSYPYFEMLVVRSIHGFRDGDTVQPEFPAPTEIGALHVSVPNAPPVAYSDAMVWVPCYGRFGGSFPMSADTQLFEACYDPTAPASGWAQVSSGFGAPDAVAWTTGALPAGSPPDVALDLTLDPWTADYGRTEVAYTHSGASASMTLGVRSARGLLETTNVEVDGDLNGGDALTVTVPADTAFHDRVVVVLRETAGLSRSETQTTTDALAATGATAPLAVTRDDLPAVAAFVLDPVARSAELTLPEGWSCASRPPNYARLSAFGEVPTGG